MSDMAASESFFQFRFGQYKIDFYIFFNHNIIIYKKNTYCLLHHNSIYCK